jgi:hypothetical protein
MALGLAWGPQLCRPAIRYTLSTSNVSLRQGEAKVNLGIETKCLTRRRGWVCKAEEWWPLASVLRCLCRWSAGIRQKCFRQSAQRNTSTAKLGPGREAHPKWLLTAIQPVQNMVQDEMGRPGGTATKAKKNMGRRKIS